MVLNDLVDSFCYSQKNAGLKGLNREDVSLVVLGIARRPSRPSPSIPTNILNFLKVLKVIYMHIGHLP